MGRRWAPYRLRAGRPPPGLEAAASQLRLSALPPKPPGDPQRAGGIEGPPSLSRNGSSSRRGQRASWRAQNHRHRPPASPVRGSGEQRRERSMAPHRLPRGAPHTGPTRAKGQKCRGRQGALGSLLPRRRPPAPPRPESPAPPQGSQTRLHRRRTTGDTACGQRTSLRD